MCENLEKHRNKNLEGFTLLEVMIALAILAVGILGIVSMHITAIEGNAGAVKFTDALLSAQGRIESILMHEFDGIDDLKHIHVRVKDSDGKIRSSLNFLKDRG
ncbi:MAG: prepilin-type N-terminal cleavage/methylation domain-containing protein [Desulfobacteraceae bacterium]|nr:prepilin-type N-terminal cleavage/methylation domain-containing protein [Desulfobacteraceae bacterium]